MRLFTWMMAAAAATGAAGCAGATMGSGVGDKLLAQPPYYAGARAARSPIGFLPIVFQRGGAFEPQATRGTPLGQLVGEMNARLQAMDRLVPIGAALPGTPPDVSFGCELDATGDCRAIDDLSDPHAKRLRLAVGRPSRDWAAAVRDAAASAGVEAVLLITLEIGQYWVHQRNLLGAKEVRLGTGLVQPIPWLTSLEAAVQVIQLTGVLVDRDGRALQIGAEGLLARRTDIVMSGIGAQALIRDADVQALGAMRRDDLPGRPLVWEAALDHLVRSLR